MSKAAENFTLTINEAGDELMRRRVDGMESATCSDDRAEAVKRHGLTMAKINRMLSQTHNEFEAMEKERTNAE